MCSEWYAVLDKPQGVHIIVPGVSFDHAMYARQFV